MRVDVGMTSCAGGQEYKGSRRDVLFGGLPPPSPDLRFSHLLQEHSEWLAPHQQTRPELRKAPGAVHDPCDPQTLHTEPSHFPYACGVETNSGSTLFLRPHQVETGSQEARRRTPSVRDLEAKPIRDSLGLSVADVAEPGTGYSSTSQLPARVECTPSASGNHR